MATILDMPQLSDTMREGVLRKWRKEEGQKVAPGEVLAEVETDKATMDFEAFDEGVLLKKLIPDGTTLPVGTPIAIIGKAGEEIAALVQEAEARARTKKGAKAGQAEAAKPAPVPAPAPAPAAATSEVSVSAGATPAAVSSPKTAAAMTRAAPAAAPAGSSNGKILASPLARRLAGDLGIDLRHVQGSGPGGRIVERDVKAVAEGGARPAPVAAPAPAPLLPERRAEPRPVAPAPSNDTEKPLSMMRKTIARRLVESKSTVPHFYLTTEVDMGAAMEFREQVSEVHGTKLSVNDLVLKAVALALRKLPEANASFGEEAITLKANVDLGMAVAIEDGLVTPVIRNADKKTLGQLSAEAKDLATRARERKLRLEEMTGSTFSVSNLGMLGVHDFCAIINPPEAGILAVGAVRKEPVVKDDKIVVGQRMSLTLSCDHRVLDGAVGARLLQAIVAILEKPLTLAF